jgi:hypothetical protein
MFAFKGDGLDGTVETQDTNTCTVLQGEWHKDSVVHFGMKDTTYLGHCGIHTNGSSKVTNNHGQSDRCANHHHDSFLVQKLGALNLCAVWFL